MTVVAAVLLPVVLLYQAWTYHVFRARLGGEDPADPVDLLGAEDRAASSPWGRSTRAWSAERGRCASCSRPTPCLGVVAALLVLAQAVLLARVAARGFAGASLAELRAPLVLLVVVAAARAARAAWGFEVAGRRAPRERALAACALDVVERRLRDRPAALDGAESAEVATLAVGGVDALETTFARYLPQLVLALVVPVAVLALVASIDLLSAGIMLLTLPLVPVFMWLDRPLHRAAHAERRRGARAALRRTSSTSSAGCRRCARSTGARRRPSGSRRSATSTGARRWGRSASPSSPARSSSSRRRSGIALVAVTVGVRLVEGGLGLEAGLTVLVLAPELYLPLRNLAAQFHASADGLAVAERLLDLLEEPAAARAPARAMPPSPRRRARPARGRLLRLPRAAGRRCSTASTSSSSRARRSRSSGRAGRGRARSRRCSCSASRSRPAGA